MNSVYKIQPVDIPDDRDRKDSWLRIIARRSDDLPCRILALVLVMHLLLYHEMKEPFKTTASCL